MTKKVTLTIGKHLVCESVQMIKIGCWTPNKWLSSTAITKWFFKAPVDAAGDRRRRLDDRVDEVILAGVAAAGHGPSRSVASAVDQDDKETLPLDTTVDLLRFFFNYIQNLIYKKHKIYQTTQRKQKKTHTVLSLDSVGNRRHTSSVTEESSC